MIKKRTVVANQKTISMGKITTREIIIIVALQKTDRGFGYRGKLPWPNISTDMEHFKKLTVGNTVIMGRKTLESIPERFRPLPERKNIIVSKTFDPKDLPKDTVLAKNLENAIQAATTPKVFIIGGFELFNRAITENYATTICTTIIDTVAPFPCDRFFPKLSPQWVSLGTSSTTDAVTGFRLKFEILKNKLNPFPLGTI